MAAPETTSPPSLYDALAPVYDRWQSADGMTPFSQVALSRLLPALERFGAASRSFLDLGCGTGDLLLGLQRAHPRWRLAGLDGSAGMLAIARAKPGAEPIEWRRGPLAPPAGASVISPAPAPFDAAGCFYDTLNHLADVAALRAAFAGVAAQLSAGGVFIFDVTNALGFDRWWRGDRTWRGPDWRVAIETAFDAGAGLARAEVTIEDRDQSTRGSLTERHFTDREIQAALAATGFDQVLRAPWSPFDIDVPGKTWWIGRIRCG